MSADISFLLSSIYRASGSLPFAFSSASSQSILLYNSNVSYQGYLYIICVEASEMEIDSRAITALARYFILSAVIISSYAHLHFCESVLSFSCSEFFIRVSSMQSWIVFNL